MKTLLFYNALSARGLSEEALRLLRSGRFSGEVRAIDFSDIAAQFADLESFDLCLVAGGDGTVSSVLGAAAGRRTPFAIAPVGTANDLARELGLSRLYAGARSLAAYISSLEGLEAKELRLWRGEPEGSPAFTFTNYLSLGFDAAVLAGFARRREAKGGFRNFGRFGNRVSYAFSSLQRLKVRLNAGLIVQDSAGQTLSFPSGSRSLIFTNLRSYMGLGRSNPGSSPFDDKLECVCARSLLDYGRMFAGSGAELSGSSSSWTLKFPAGMALQADGEVRLVGEDLRIVPAGVVRVLTDH